MEAKSVDSMTTFSVWPLVIKVESTAVLDKPGPASTPARCKTRANHCQRVGWAVASCEGIEVMKRYQGDCKSSSSQMLKSNRHGWMARTVLLWSRAELKDHLINSQNTVQIINSQKGQITNPAAKTMRLMQLYKLKGVRKTMHWTPWGQMIQHSGNILCQVWMGSCRQICQKHCMHNVPQYHQRRPSGFQGIGKWMKWLPGEPPK